MLSPKLFKDFKQWCQHYRNRFGLKDWNIVVEGKKLDRTKDATCAFNLKGRCATITCNVALDTMDVKNVACHEIVHIVLAEVEMLATWRDTTEDSLNRAMERLVVHLTNVVIEAEEQR